VGKSQREEEKEKIAERGGKEKRPPSRQKNFLPPRREKEPRFEVKTRKKDEGNSQTEIFDTRTPRKTRALSSPQRNKRKEKNTNGTKRKSEGVFLFIFYFFFYIS